MSDTYRQQQLDLIKRIETGAKDGTGVASIIESHPDYAADMRLCLTCVTFLPPELQAKIKETFQDPLRALDPRQYFFAPESLHLTVQNIRTISSPPLFNEMDIAAAAEVLGKVIHRHPVFSYNFFSLLPLPTSVSAVAVADQELQDLIFDLRGALDTAGIPDNKVYASSSIFFGNSTFCRYVEPPTPEFLAKIEELKDIPLGTLELRQVSLAVTNAVFHPSLTKIIATFPLQES